MEIICFIQIEQQICRNEAVSELKELFLPQERRKMLENIQI